MSGLDRLEEEMESRMKASDSSVAAAARANLNSEALVPDSATKLDSAYEFAAPNFGMRDSAIQRPLWKSLFLNVKDALFPPKQAPLILTSRPLDPSEQHFTVEEKSTLGSLFANLKAMASPEKQAPLVLTSKPVAAGEERFTVEQPGLFASLAAGVKGLLNPEKQAPLVLTSRPVGAGEEHFTVERPGLWASLAAGVKGVFAPEKLPPLMVTSQPIAVKKLWGFYDHSRQGAIVSFAVHVVAIAAVLAFFLWPRDTKAAPPKNTQDLGTVTLTLPPDLSRSPKVNYT